MSNKRWWLPTQKGTDLFPKVTIAPPKLVIQGAPPNTKLFHSLAQKFGGQLKSFHGKAQQDYSLSDNPIMKRHAQFGDDARATYTNIDGQETIKLEVAGPVVEQAKKEIEVPKPWEWALVEYHVPLTGAEGMHVFMKAIRTIPRSVEAGITNDGFVFDYSFTPINADGLDPPVLRYPASDAIDMETTIVGNVQISSLAIDLRRFFGAPVTVELWGYSIGSGMVPDLYHAPDAELQSQVDHTLGSATFDEDTGIWAPDVLSVVSGWPYYGVAQVPEGWPGDSPLYTGLSVPAENAPRRPVTMSACPNSPLPESTITPTESQAQHFDTIVYDAASGIATSFIAHPLVNDGGTAIGGNQFTYVFGWQDQTYSREVTTEYTLAVVPTECHGEIRFAGGFGAIPWKNMKVTNDATEFGRLYFNDGQFMSTVPIAEDVVVTGDTGVSYQLLGKFSVFPFQYTAGFTKA